MKFSELTQTICPLLVSENDSGGDVYDPDITSIHYSSKDVKPGGVFVAIKGLAADGHTFINDAVTKGAAAIVVESSGEKLQVPSVCVSDSRKALALMADRFYNSPSDSLHMTVITGTNGKTTITYLLESIFTEAGYSTGVIGTVNYRFCGNSYPNPMTTPESLDLQRILSEMAAAGVTHVVMEVSSHAIDLDRVAGCHFDTAVFTNLSQDHLDYHKTMDAYWECKERLFTEIMTTGKKRGNAVAVINSCDPKGIELIQKISYTTITTGTSDAAIQSADTCFDIRGISGTIVTPDAEFTFSSDAIGRHNLENILNSVGAAIAAGVPTSAIKKGIEQFRVPGRLERVNNSKSITVFVDYAHTPDALENVLKTVRPLTPGKLITVFGCGGDRDSGKRPVMGAIASQYSDLTVITSDNPRTENPDTIIRHIVDGISAHATQYSGDQIGTGMNGKGYVVVEDRKKAIQLSARSAKEGDSILIAGKGHETYQITNEGTIDFDDRIEAEKALETDEN